MWHRRMMCSDPTGLTKDGEVMRREDVRYIVEL